MFRVTTNSTNGVPSGTGELILDIRWPLPPEGLLLSSDDVHIFCIHLDVGKQRLAQLGATLSSDEIARALRFHFEKDRSRYIAARGILREILGWLLGVEPKQLLFSCGERGKPQLADSINGQFLHFNVSHSDWLALIAVSRDFEVGVDIERIRPVETTEPLVTQFFSPEEQREWFSLPASRRAETFFDHWTRTEAFLKFNGEGIGDFPYPIFKCEGDCLVQSLRPVPNYAGAIVVQNPAARVLCWKWISKNDCYKAQIAA
ncbi:MAG TPA: 4'-phosphopantetheinyl transferase superfamily protein [Desulfuromonadaceae bacterium]|nr:4'-phosphopantetheinyl transferase superfamily protein [Desulfuromonadaceae bacterium]